MSAATAVINLTALQHNLSRVRETATKSQIYAVIKSNGYGHGLVPVAKALSNADGLAVARMDEALTLKHDGIQSPIVVLGGIFDEVGIRRASAQGIEFVVHNEQQLELVTETAKNSDIRGLNIWLKVDTGMHRLGFAPEELAGVLQKVNDYGCAAKVSVLTHLANADDLQDDRTEIQLSRFKVCNDIIVDSVSIANSAGILGWPQTHVDIVRPGIMLYGSSPIIGKTAEELNLLPVMTLKSELISIRQMKKGDHIGYGGDWRCRKNSTIGVVAIGYGDGYPRHAKTGTPVLINGKVCKLVGRVSMDMICVDITVCPSAKLGDTAILWGDNLPADEVAKHAKTISYDLFCGVTSRVVFNYVHNR